MPSTRVPHGNPLRSCLSAANMGPVSGTRRQTRISAHRSPRRSLSSILTPPGSRLGIKAKQRDSLAASTSPVPLTRMGPAADRLPANPVFELNGSLGQNAAPVKNFGASAGNRDTGRFPVWGPLPTRRQSSAGRVATPPRSVSPALGMGLAIRRSPHRAGVPSPVDTPAPGPSRGATCPHLAARRSLSPPRGYGGLFGD